MRAAIFKGCLLASVSITLSPSILAQVSDEQESRQETVIVSASPIRDSQAAAIEAKRNAPNVSDVISADVIGRFPDQNLAESLGRVPGLAIERDQGQARYINFRGAPQRYTTIAFDGISVPGVENGRLPRFDSFPSVITSQVQANKAITPDMPGESIAGFINIKTFDPFANEGFSFSGEAGHGEQELGGGPVNQYNLRGSYSTDQFGIVLYGSTNSRVQNTDNREYSLDFSDPANPLIEDVDFRSYFVDREANSYGGTLEFRPEGLIDRVFVSSLFSEFKDHELRNQYVFEFNSGPVAPNSAGQDVVVITRALQDGLYENSTFTNTLGFDASLGEWDTETRFNYTKTENEINLFLPFSIGAAALGIYDLSNVEDPTLNLLDFTGQPTNMFAIDQGGYPFLASILVGNALENEVYKVKFDAARDITLFGNDAVLKTGLQLDTREADGFAVAFPFGGFPDTVDITDFLTDTPWYTDFSNTIGGTYYDNEGLNSAWGAAIGGFSIDVPPENVVGIEEDIFSAYAMATVEKPWGNMVFGARVEATDFSTSGNILDQATDTVSNRSASNDYVHFLPGVHVNVDLSDDLKLRLSGTTGISRPTYEEARASVSVDPTDPNLPAITGGNPDLEAEFAYGGDIALEYYFADASLLSVGAFGRYIDNVIFAGEETVADGSDIAPGQIAPGTPAELNSFFNGKDGELFGLEINFIGQAEDFLPAPFDGFGVSGNITVLDSEFSTQQGRKFNLPGTSDLIYNASVFYEKFGLSARLNYQYRDAWLTETEDNSGGEFWDEQSRLDASIRYHIPHDFGGARVTLFANANNLTEEIDVRYEQSARTPNQVEGYGSRYLIGFRVDY